MSMVIDKNTETRQKFVLPFAYDEKIFQISENRYFYQRLHSDTLCVVIILDW